MVRQRRNPAQSFRGGIQSLGIPRRTVRVAERCIPIARLQRAWRFRGPQLRQDVGRDSSLDLFSGETAVEPLTVTRIHELCAWLVDRFEKTVLRNA